MSRIKGIRMQNLFKIVLVWVVIFFTACGGGGSGEGSTRIDSLNYIGKTTAANLDEVVVQKFIKSLDITSSNNDLDVSNDVIQKASNTVVSKTSGLVSNLNKQVNGTVSGSVDVTRSTISSVKTEIIAVFDNYNDGDDETLNGEVTYVITTNNGVITAMTMTFKLLQMKDDDDDISMSGEIDVVDSSRIGKTFTQNIVFKNNEDDSMMRLEDFVIVFDENDKELSYSGKVYASELGYVVVSTAIELSYNENGELNAGGEIHYQGKDSTIIEKSAYDNTVRLEVDEGSNGTVDKVEIYDSSTFTIIPNREPVISISFPQSIYTDTDMSQVTIDIYDPDLDAYMTEYEWYVDDKIESTTLAISNKLFKKHQTVKLKVMAIDDREGDAKVGSSSVEQMVLNSKPIVKLLLDKTNIEVGDKIVLDASGSYDVDGDSILFDWQTQNRGYNIHDDAYTQGTLYLDINESNRSKVSFLGEEPNYDNFKEIKPYGVKVTLDDQDGGLSEFNSSDIIVNVMDLFNRDSILLDNHNISTDSITSFGIGDLNNDGLIDIAITTDSYGDYADNSKLIILFQNNLNQFTEVKKISLEDISPYSYDNIVVADVNNDELNDIAISSITSNGFNVYYQNNDGSFSTKTYYETKTFSYNPFPEENFLEESSNSVKYMNTADLNNDGKEDIVTVGQSMLGTGIDIFIQNDGNLSSERNVLLDGYEDHNKHLSSYIDVQDIDNNDLQDLVIANYILYQEENGTFTEVLYNDVERLTVLNDSKLIGVNGFDKHLSFYTKDTNRIYEKEEKGIDILLANTTELYSADVTGDGKKDIILGHEAYNNFTILVQKENGFYGNQVYSLNSELNFTYNEKTMALKDIDNNGKEDIFFLGRNGFEIFYTK